MSMQSQSKEDILKAIEALGAREINDLEARYEHVAYLAKLNKGQKIAATRTKGNFLVIAGPGTGKTHTLSYRVYHMMREGIDPKKIVVITFTRKAGNELKYRISKLMPNTELGFVGTFHGLANHISQMKGAKSPISKFRLLDSDDDRQVHSLVMADYQGFDGPMKASRLQKIISYCANTGMTATEYIKKFDIRNLMDQGPAIDDYRLVYESYKADHMLANYDDMITKISHHLEGEDPDLTLPFEYLMIDEYQDTNRMQLDFIRKLKINNVMAIGDDFQGIYSFRGADHKIILNFFNDFEAAQMIKLTQNYRSVPAIVDWVNQTVEASPLGYQKALTAEDQREGQVQVMAGSGLESNKDYILSEINKYPNESHALIYRYNKHRSVFEKAFLDEGIEYLVYGGVRLLERKHIKDVLAFLMVYLNRRDVVSYNRILTLYPGIGPKTANRLMKYDLKDRDRLNDEKNAYIDQVRSILDFQGTKEALLEQVMILYKDLYEAIESEYYTYDEIKEDFKILEDLLETHDSLENFIINLILDPVVDYKKGQNPKVVLTTIHSAKGLEFDRVYYFHSHDWYKNYDLEQTEEDRRLFYVGISRAKRHLTIFDHTEVIRPFESILKDFDKVDMASPGDAIGNGSETKNEGFFMDQGSEKSFKQWTIEPQSLESSIKPELSESTPKTNIIQVDFGRRTRKY